MEPVQTKQCVVLLMVFALGLGISLSCSPQPSDKPRPNSARDDYGGGIAVTSRGGRAESYSRT